MTRTHADPTLTTFSHVGDTNYLICSHRRPPTTRDLRFLLVRRQLVRLRPARRQRVLPVAVVVVLVEVEARPAPPPRRLRLVHAATPRPDRVTRLLPLLLLLWLPLAGTQREGTRARTATRTRIAYRMRRPSLKDSTMAVVVVVVVVGVERARTTRRAVLSPSGRVRRGANRPIMDVTVRGTRRQRGIGVRSAGTGIANTNASGNARGKRSGNAETVTAIVTVATAVRRRRRRGDLRPGVKTRRKRTESRTTGATRPPGCGSAVLVIGRTSGARAEVDTTRRRRRRRRAHAT